MHTWQRHLVLTCALAAVALVLAGAARAWTWPLPGPVLRPYVFDPELPLEPGQHRGLDVEGTLGAPVLAPVGGHVSFVGTVPTGGRTITIETPDGYSATLLHLGSVVVHEGADVEEGATVAFAGTSGVPEQAVPYVHFGIRLTNDPQGYLDPQLLLPPLGAPSVPGDPPAPPDPQPVSSAPPATAPPGPAPSTPGTTDGPPPRTAAPTGGVPQRPVSQTAPSRIAVAAPAPALAPTAPESSPTLATAAGPATLAVRPAETAALAAGPSVSPVHTSGRIRATTLAADARPVWLRVPDAFVGSPAEQASSATPRSLPRPAPALALLALTVLVGLCARAFGRRVARIIGGDALLPDHADLLRECEPAHRARVHDDRRGRTDPAPQAAR